MRNHPCYLVVYYNLLAVFAISVNYHFHVSFSLKFILYVVEMTQNVVNELP